MPKEFYSRLRDDYLNVAKVLRGEADAASVFPNTSDIGVAREKVYATFLQQHAPSKCNVFLGGFLFHEDGSESKQLDVIVTTDTTPRFNFHNPQGDGKSFSPVEGTLGVASIKSTLDKKQLFDSLDGIASIPPTQDLKDRTTLGFQILNYDDWPYKIVYASDGIAGETILKHIGAYYAEHPEVPMSRRPNLIHVAGQYMVLRMNKTSVIRNRVHGTERRPKHGSFQMFVGHSDVQAITACLTELQSNALASSHVLTSYNYIANGVADAFGNLDQRLPPQAELSFDTQRYDVV